MKSALALATSLALLLALVPATIAAAQESVDSPDPDDGVAIDADRVDQPGSLDEFPEPEHRSQGVVDRYFRRGAGMPRVTYQVPPFDGDEYWVLGGVMATEDPVKFLMPLDVLWVYDMAGQMGLTLEGRLWGNALWSWGIEFWGVARPSQLDGIFEKSPRVEGVWRIQTDISFLGWMHPMWGFELGLLFGLEKDILTTQVQNRDIGILWGFTGRVTAWRFQLRTDWLMRIDDDQALGYGQLRHAFRGEIEFEAVRIDHFGLVLGYWTYFVTGGKPRNGLSVGIRVWFAPGRSKPDWTSRYDSE